MNDEETTERTIRNRLKKKEKKARPDLRTDAEKDIDAALERSVLTKQANRDRRRRFKMAGWAAGGLFLMYVIWWLFFSLEEGSMAFGICKVFLELNTRYPQTLHLSTVEEFADSVRIWYAETDSGGEYRLEPIQCYFKADEKLGFILDKITVNRRELDPGRIDAFNRVLPVLLKKPPDLTLPEPLSDSLEDLQINVDRFRKPIFN